MPFINDKYYTDEEVEELLLEHKTMEAVESFLVSVAIGAVTGSSLIGGLLGGDLLGGIVGDICEGGDDSWF